MNYVECQAQKLSFEEILSKFNGVKEHDGYYMALCPAHENTKTPALSISQKDNKVLFHCFAGCKGEDIAKAANIPLPCLFLDGPKDDFSHFRPLTISELAYHKKLPPEFLAKFTREVQGSEMKSKFGIGKGKDNWAAVQITYKDMAGSETACLQRFRTQLTAGEGSYWDKSKRPMVMFGLWQIPSFTQDYLLMPEGETNAITLWYHDQPALSFPGCTMVAKLQSDHISKFQRLYVCYDKDQGGDTLAIGLLKQLKKIKYQGKAFVVIFPEGCKDVSDLHCNYLESFDAELQKCMDAAVPLADFVKQIAAKNGQKEQAAPTTTGTNTAVLATDSKIIKTIVVSKTSYYEVTSQGVFFIHSVKNKETDEYEQVTTKICADPVYISERLVDIFHSTSQVRLVWGHKECVIPTTCLSGTDMKVLTDLGLRILTPNGSDMAKYFLASLEELSAESNFASRNGWLNRKYTQLILGQKILEPDRKDNIARYDDDALDLSQQGDRKTWLEIVKTYFGNPYIALAMSASAAGFLVAPLGVESSILHFFGDSSCGKSTATLFAASLWGQPMMTQDKSIRKNWNSTPVGIELYWQQMFNMTCFLEDSADVKDDETLVRLAQAFVNGSGRNRGTIAKKSGGLAADRTKYWQTLLLSTGEKRISDASNMGGVAARTMEVEVSRFATYKQSDFQTMRATLANNFGFGEEIVSYWFQHQEEIKQKFTEFLNLLEESFKTISETKIRCLCALALILTGHYLLGQVFNLENLPLILEIIEKIVADDEPKGSKGVYESLVEHYTSNSSRFGSMQPSSIGGHTYCPAPEKDELGIYHPGIEAVCFYTDKLKMHLKKLGYSTSQLAILRKDGKLITTIGRGNRYAMKIKGIFVSVYAIKIPTEPQNDEEKRQPATEKATETTTD